jgi:hypothetical protein
LGSVMNLDTQITTMLLAIRACARCSNDARIIQDALSALKHVLLLLEAEQSVYAAVTRTQTPEDSCLGPHIYLSSDLPDGSPQAPKDSMKERFVFGSIILDDWESTVVARRLIRDAAMRIGQNLRWISLKRKSGTIGSIHHSEQFDQEIEVAMDRVKIMVERTSLHFS